MVALFAASGNLPSVLAEEVKRRGQSLLVVAVTSTVDNRVRQIADSYVELGPGELQRAIDTCRGHAVEAVAFAGKLEKRDFCAGLELDSRMRTVLSAVANHGDDALMRSIAAEFETEGFAVLSQIELAQALLAPQGVMTRTQPTRGQMADIAHGIEALRVMGPLDVGQSVVVKQRVIVAVEGVEGTDQAVLRGGTLAGGDAVVVKAAKPGQDLRFDVPAVGENTIASMHAAGCKVLAVESGSTIVIDRNRAVCLADRHGICIIGI
jgi:DUF1009 family protein